jgi:hypothetical protein
MKDENADKPAEFDAEIKLWYRAQAQETPSAELDDAIMSLAKSANQSKKADNLVVVDNSFWRRHRWPISSAASVMFVATLLLINQDETQELLSNESYAPVMMQMEADAKESELPVTLRKSEPRAMMSAPSVDEQQVQLQGAAQNEVIQVNANAAEDVSLQSGNGDVKAKIKSLSDSKSIKTMSQRDAVVSAKQAVNHLESLVKQEQWVEAEKLVLKIRKNYPQLKNEDHPQHLRWKTLSEQVIIPLPKPSVPASDK